MPLIAWIIAGYLAGLCAGFGGVAAVVASTAAVVTVAGIVAGRARVATIACLVVVGTVSARTAPVAGPLPSPAGWAARARAAATRTTVRDFRSDAPLVQALVLADMREIPPEIRDRWAVAGMVHMLSVSGLHVGIIAAVIELLAGVLRIGRRTAPLAALGVIAVYVALIGAPAPAVRSAVMLGVRAVARVLQRSVSPWAVLALGASQPVLQPRVVLDLGYQLSVIGVAALIAAERLVRRLPTSKWPRWSRPVVSGAVCTVVATVASLPLVAWNMGRVSLIAPVSNLLAGPLIALAQPMLFLGILLAPMPSAASFVADASHPLLAALNAIAAGSAAIPGAALTVWPSTRAAIVSAVVAAAVLAACASRHWARPLMLAALGAAALAWMPGPRAGEFTELHMIDVGQGDAIALRTRAGRWVLFDAGRIWEGGDAGRRIVVPYLAHRGGRLAAFVLSHPHSDHVGGAASVLEGMSPTRYVDAAFVTSNEAYRASLIAARAHGVLWARARPGDSLVVDEATIVFLAPDSAFAVSLPDPNNASTVALIRIGKVRMLMMGDAEREEEEWLLENEAGLLPADVLKVGHHGSATSSTPRFLDAVHPRIALVSVGAGNTYGHPSTAVIGELASRGAVVARTDLRGTVVVETDGKVVRIRDR